LLEEESISFEEFRLKDGGFFLDMCYGSPTRKGSSTSTAAFLDLAALPPSSSSEG